MSVADLAVEEELCVYEFSCRRGRVIGIWEFVATGDTANSPLFGLQRTMVADERSVSYRSSIWNVFFLDKFNCVCCFNTMFVSLGQAANFVA